MPPWILAVFKQEWRRLLSYRVDFWINFLGTSAIQLAIAYSLWSAIFTQAAVSSIRGMDLNTLMFYYLLAPLSFRSTTGPMMEFLSTDIYLGGLNKYLLYPLSYLNFKLTTHLANSLFYFLQFILVFTIYSLLFTLPPTIEVSILNSLLFTLFIMMGSVLYFFMASIFELISFWADNIWSLMVMLRFIMSLFGGLMIPLTFFPVWAQHLLSLLPFQYLIFFPIKVFMGQYTSVDLLQAVLVIMAWTIICKMIVTTLWSRGTKQYSGIGI
jgi:ABC-2 type transport system permease protein